MLCHYPTDSHMFQNTHNIYTSSTSSSPTSMFEDKQTNLISNYSKPVPTASRPCPIISSFPATSNPFTNPMMMNSTSQPQQQPHYPTSSNSPQQSTKNNSRSNHHHMHNNNNRTTTSSPISHTSSSKSSSNNHNHHHNSTSPANHRGIQKRKREYSHSAGGGSSKKSNASSPSSNKKKSKISVTVSDLIRVMPLPQTVAAKELGISLSTLKRRFYELNMGRWPGLVTGSSSNTVHHHFTQHIDDRSSSSSNSNDSVSSCRKAELSYVLNSSDLEANFMDQITLAVLNIAFKQNL